MRNLTGGAFAGPRLRASIFILAQQLAGLSIEKVQPCTCWADDPFIFVFANIRMVIQKVLDVEIGRRAPEHERGHRPEYGGPGMLGHDLAQGSLPPLSI